MKSNAASLRPETPPEIKRKVVLGLHQRVGGGVMLLIPLLALAQLLGDRTRSLEVVQEGMVVHAEAPSGARYGSPVQLCLTVFFPRGNGAHDVRVYVNAVYLDHFVQIHTLPDVQEVRGGDYAFSLKQNDDERGLVVRMELTPARWGWAEGQLRVEAEGRSAEVPLRTFIFP